MNPHTKCISLFLTAAALFVFCTLSGCAKPDNATDTTPPPQPEVRTVALTAEGGTEISVQAETAQAEDGSTVTTLTAPEFAALTTAERLAMADDLLTEAGYLPEDLARLEDTQKLAMASTDQLTVKTAYYEVPPSGEAVPVSEADALAAVEDAGSASRSTGWMRATFSYSRVSEDRYLVTLLCKFLAAPSRSLTDFTSICVQGCAADVETARCRYGYDSVLDGKEEHVTVTYDSSSNEFEAIGGTGAGIGFRIPPIPYEASGITQKNIFTYTSCYFNNSNVVPGGKFNLYGAYSHQIVSGNPPPSSFPWGLDDSSRYVPCRVILLAAHT